MLDPYTNPTDTPVNDTPTQRLSKVSRQKELDDGHPLARIRLIVDQASAQRQSQAALNAGFGGSVDQRIVRLAILQTLYSFGCNELLMDHLRYNSMYRWFVGLKEGENPWCAASYADALTRVLNTANGSSMLRSALIPALSCAATAPSRFCIDDRLVERWTSVLRNSVSSNSSAMPAHSDRCQARIERARDIILRRIGDHELTPESIAAEMCMSRRALFLLFEKHGLTPTRVIRDLRLDHSRRLLADRNHRHRKITDIALDLGFSHPGTFSRKFKDRFGVSPIDIRSRGETQHQRAPIRFFANASRFSDSAS